MSIPNPLPPLAKSPDVVVKPCPFCGDTDPSLDEIDSDVWAVCCNACGAIGPHLTDDGSKVLGERAIALWNASRAPA